MELRPYICNKGINEKSVVVTTPITFVSANCSVYEIKILLDPKHSACLLTLKNIKKAKLTL